MWRQSRLSSAGDRERTTARRLRKNVEKIKRVRAERSRRLRRLSQRRLRLRLLILQDQPRQSVGLPVVAVGVAVLQLLHNLLVERLILSVAFGDGRGARQ